MLGSHLIKAWSSTQPNHALSSGEAEYYGSVKAGGAGLGYQALLEDLGAKLPLRVWTDSTAAMGVATRQGVGKIRHLDTRTLWMQQAVRSGRIEFRKVLGTENPADLFTKHMPSQEKLEQVMNLFACRSIAGRSKIAPKMRRERLTQELLGDSHHVEDFEICNRETLPHLEKGFESRYGKLSAPTLDHKEPIEDEDILESIGSKVVQTIMRQAGDYGRKIISNDDNSKR